MWIDKSNKLFNPAAKHVIDGVPYHGNVLAFPAVVAKLGLQEIAEDPKPEGYTDELFTRYEDWNATQRPYIVYTPRGVEQARQVLRARVKQLRNQKETEGFPYLGKWFDSDERSVQRMNTTVQTAQVVGAAFSTSWTDADDTDVLMDHAAMLGMPVALAQHAGVLHAYARTLKLQIEAETDFDVLKAMDVTVGWPAGEAVPA